MPEKMKKFLMGLLLIAVLALGTVVWAQTSGSYNLTWSVIGGGGGSSSSASYEVEGTVGQAVASGAVGASSSSYQLSSGFWFADAPIRLYLPTIAKP